MARWEPNPRGRLLHAALDLFAEQGYEATTTAQLAERAGLTKATVFRLFADKREILFQGQDASVRTVRTAVAQTPADLGALEVAREALRALSEDHVPEQQEIGRRIDAILATSTDLRERAAFKRWSIGAALEQALTERGEQPALAGTLADLAMRAYYDGFADWTVAGADASLTDAVMAHLDALIAVLPSIVAGDTVGAGRP